MRMESNILRLLISIIILTHTTQIKMGLKTSTVVTSFMPLVGWPVANLLVIDWILTNALPSTVVLFITVIVTVAYATIARLFSFYFAKSNSFPTLVDLIFPLILSIHVTFILSYPYIFTFTLTHPLSFLQMRWLLFYDDTTGTKDRKAI